MMYLQYKYIWHIFTTLDFGHWRAPTCGAAAVDSGYDRVALAVYFLYFLGRFFFLVGDRRTGGLACRLEDVINIPTIILLLLYDTIIDEHVHVDTMFYFIFLHIGVYIVMM